METTMNRTMYAVVLEDCFVQDAAALFDDQTHAETHAESMTDDPDYDGRYRVVPVWVDGNAIVEQEPVKETPCLTPEQKAALERLRRGYKPDEEGKTQWRHDRNTATDLALATFLADDDLPMTCQFLTEQPGCSTFMRGRERWFDFGDLVIIQEHADNGVAVGWKAMFRGMYIRTCPKTRRQLRRLIAALMPQKGE
jgi:hypothetical protein